MSEITRESGSAIRACGNAEVLMLLENFTKEVLENPNIGYASLVLVEKDGVPHGGYAGDVQLEAKAERATMSAAEGIRDRVFNRILPQRDPTVSADYVCYNVPSGSLSYDFLVWLIDAEMTRVRDGAPPPLKVHFWYGRDGKAGIYLPAQQRMMDHVVRPSLALLGAVEDPDAAHGRYKNFHQLRDVTNGSRAGEAVPRFKAPAHARSAMLKWLNIADEDARRPVTITLRETAHWTHRNSNIEAWLQFGRYLEDKGERVIFVRDTARAAEPLIGFETCPEAAISLAMRMALVEQSKCNLYVSNGPCTLGYFSDRPWLTFVQAEADGAIYEANTPAFWRIRNGLDVDEQYPWSTPNQRLIWQPDTYENIVAAWESLPMNAAKSAPAKSGALRALRAAG